MTAFLGFKILLIIWRNANGNKKEVNTEINKVSWIFKVKLIFLSFLTLFAGTIGFNTVFGDISFNILGQRYPNSDEVREGVGKHRKIYDI
jgi:NADH:ubiquinone oxidoreductase subunit 5 (subunit L)/multisubunit Na+/H+ antiporter MnhA subunit